MALFVDHEQAVVVVVVVVKHVAYRRHERVRQVVPVAPCAHKTIHAPPQVFPAVNERFEASVVFEEHLLEVLPLQVAVYLILDGHLLKCGILTGFQILLVPIAEELLVLRQAHNDWVPLRSGAFGVLVHQEKGDQELLVVVTSVCEQVWAFTHNILIQLGFLFLKSLG